MSDADPLNAGAWTGGSLIYFGRPLGEVIEDVQRYTPRRILIDRGAAAYLYSGSVVQKHIDQWIRGLSEVFPIEVIDCRLLQNPIDTAIDEAASACTSDPSLVVIRPR